MTNQEGLVTRRAFIGGVKNFVVAGAIAAPSLYVIGRVFYPRVMEELFPRSVGGSTEHLPILEDYFPTTAEVQYALPSTQAIDLENSESLIDRDFVGEIVTQLHQNQRGNFSPEERAQAVVGSLRYLEFGDGRIATATQIEQSGHFLTAAHTISKYPPDEYTATGTVYGDNFYITNPWNGTKVTVRSAFFIPNVDIAVLYAPTGLEPNIDPRLAFELNPPGYSFPAWMYALRRDSRLVFLHGNTSPEAARNSSPIIGPNRDLAIEGMIPFGGSSGAPVVNESGIIVGVEGGVLVDKGVENDRSYYLGSAVTSLRFLPKLEGEGIILPLQSDNG